MEGSRERRYYNTLSTACALVLMTSFDAGGVRGSAAEGDSAAETKCR